LVFWQPFKGFIRVQTGYKGIKDLLQRKHRRAPGS
jgi:hypothetical protein